MNAFKKLVFPKYKADAYMNSQWLWYYVQVLCEKSDKIPELSGVPSDEISTSEELSFIAVWRG